ncbi:MAG: NAD-dependent epimerase/dehydratase family protein [Rhodovibrionaceae bacterium]
MTILVTGAAGFIGSHVARLLLARGEAVIGVDSLNAYYDPELKRARLARLEGERGFTFHEIDVSDRAAMLSLAESAPEIEGIVHLAAQAGVRHSLEDPYAYVTANVMGQLVAMEAARRLPALKHLVYASSSSVYGESSPLPFSTEHPADDPVSLYAATKRADELMAQSYANLHGLPLTGLRIFTVYGPWGRPDMSLFLFTKAVLAGETIRVFNRGRMKRDFTYIDDLADGVVRALDRPPGAGAASSHRIYNLGNARQESLMDMIAAVEAACGREAIKEFVEMQPGDVTETWAEIGPARRDLGFDPKTTIAEGVPRFVAWFRDYYAL